MSEPDDVQAAWNEKQRRWLIAEDVVVETKNWSGRFIVEDVEEGYNTVTYKMVSADLTPPPLGLGLLRPPAVEES